ncbi:MAG: hypothetical protein GY940_05640, partial [bacterium]|nr:hypothetical protein [bacterium]
LLRVGLLELQPGPGAPNTPQNEPLADSCIMVMDVHHIAHDGTSQAIFLKEFFSLYEDRSLPGLSIQYKDYARWQNREIQRGVLKNQEDYWLKEFDPQGEIPVLNLPADYSRPARQTFDGRMIRFQLEAEKTMVLKALAIKEDVTLFIVLLSLYGVLLAQLSGQEDIVIGTPVAGRKHPDTQPIIGMFLNTLALRNYPAGTKPFKTFLAEVKERTLQAFDHQDYPFENLVERAVSKRDLSRNPLFDALFILHNEFQSAATAVTPVTGEADLPIK